MEKEEDVLLSDGVDESSFIEPKIKTEERMEQSKSDDVRCFDSYEQFRDALDEYNTTNITHYVIVRATANFSQTVNVKDISQKPPKMRWEYHAENDQNDQNGQGYDVKQMRQHLLSCVEIGKLSPFPRKNKRVKISASHVVYEDIYCVCRRPFFEKDVENDRGLCMAGCTECGEWYHRKCVGINNKVFLNSTVVWKCPKCTSA